MNFLDLDKGPWSAGVTEDMKRVFIQSDDFNHDVRLYVDGDFGGFERKLQYAYELAKFMNKENK